MSRMFDRIGRRKITNTDGTADQAFDRLMSKAFSQIEEQLTSLQTQLTAIQAAQATADAAVLEAARLSSYTSPSNVLTAADVGADCTITIANHTRVYPVQGSVDVADLSITGGTITGQPFSTAVYVYYDDTTLEDTTPTFLATTTPADAQVGAAAGRHFVGLVTTPANGAASTSGTGGAPPGGGGTTTNPLP